MKTVLLVVAMLAGCATSANIPGVKITDDERIECAKTKACAVWTQGQLIELIRHAIRQGYLRGRAEANTL